MLVSSARNGNDTGSMGITIRSNDVAGSHPVARRAAIRFPDPLRLEFSGRLVFSECGECATKVRIWKDRVCSDSTGGNRDNYNYEKGGCALVKLSWDNKRSELVIAERKGSFATMVKSREYQLVFISDQGRQTKTVRYTGKEMKVSAAG
jgi:hypothetical protein